MTPTSSTPQAPETTVERLRRWARRYPLPLGLTGLFLLTLAALIVVSPGHTRATQERAPSPSAAPARVKGKCPACRLGERCDETTGQCVLETITPPPCVKGAHLDEEAGHCVPDETARPSAPTSESRTSRATPRPSAAASPTPSGAPETTPSPTAKTTPKPSSTPPQATPGEEQQTG